MKLLREFINSLTQAKRDNFASRCKTTVGYLRKACSIHQQLGADLCILIDRESGGLVSCESLRPDVDWAYLREHKEPAVVEPGNCPRAESATPQHYPLEK